MFEGYKVAVKLTLINDVSKGLLLVSSQFKVLNEAMTAYERRLTRIKTLMGVGAGALGGSFALAAPFIYAISKAAELQKQMLGIQIATVGTAAQMDKMRVAIERASSTTMFSAVDVAKIAKIIATSNTFSAPQLTSLLPAYSRFADVQLLMKGTPYQESVLEAVRLAHTAQLYTPKALSSYLDTLTKASIITGGNITELGTALKYSQGTAQTALGVDPKTMVLLTALLNRLGFSGSRGGTNLIDAMIRTMPGIFGSGLLEGKSNEALRAMGLTDSKGHSLVFTNGKFDVMKWMEGLSHYVNAEMRRDPEAIARQKILTNFQHAFGAQGRRVATLLANPKALQQLMLMDTQFSNLASTGTIQDIFVKKSVSQQFQAALTNFQNVMIELGVNLLPLATRVLNEFNKELNILIPWMRKNKGEVKLITEAFIGLAAALAVSGTIAILAAGFAALATPVGLVVAGITALGVALYKLWGFMKGDFSHSNISSATPGNSSNNIANVHHIDSSFFYHPGASNHPSHIFLNMDGKTVASIVTHHQATQSAHQPAHGSYTNGQMSLVSNALNFIP